MKFYTSKIIYIYIIKKFKFLIIDYYYYYYCFPKKTHPFVTAINSNDH